MGGGVKEKLTVKYKKMSNRKNKSGKITFIIRLLLSYKLWGIGRLYTNFLLFRVNVDDGGDRFDVNVDEKIV